MLAAVCAPGSAAEVVLATHNQASIQAAAAEMGRLGLQRSNPAVSFGQLYGMADHLTYILATAGYKVPPPPPPPSRGATPLFPGGGRWRRRFRASEHTQKPLSVCAQLALTEQAFYASAPNRQITRNQHANGRPPRLLSLRAPTFV